MHIIDGLSPKLAGDIEKLINLSPENLKGLADAYRTTSIDSFEGSVAQALMQEMGPYKEPSDVIASCVHVSLFILHQWVVKELTKEQIIEDVRALGITEEQERSLVFLLDAMDEKRGPLSRQAAESHVLGTGTPTIDSANCVCEARAVFQGLKYDKGLDDSQPYFQLDRFVPVVILELVSDLNDQKTNHNFLLAEKTLAQFCDILNRAKERLERVKAALESTGNVRD